MRRVAVITGGTRGIGWACAQAFARSGWTALLLWNSREETAREREAALRGEGLDAAALRCDVSDAAQVRQVFAEIEGRWHHVDALVNCAGIAHIGLFQDTDEETWRRIMAVNLDGAYRCARAVLPGMISRRSGSIIQIASMWGEVGASCEVAYSASKAGLIGLTKALAKEVGPSGVRVNCVSPGVIDTEMNAELSPEALRELAEETPLGRIGTPEDVARAVLFLAGEDSAFITGQVIGVSGGLVV